MMPVALGAYVRELKRRLKVGTRRRHLMAEWPTALEITAAHEIVARFSGSEHLAAACVAGRHQGHPRGNGARIQAEQRRGRTTMRIGLIAIYVDDQDQAERFYTETLGFQVKTSAAHGVERWLSLVSPEEPDGLELTLHLADEPARAFQATRRQIGRPVFALHTDDCQGEADRLKAKGVVFVKEPSRMPYGGMDAVFDDTCGNLVDLHQD